MALSLPANPDLERFRRDARRLQRAVRLAEPEALAHAARHHPEGVPSDPTTSSRSAGPAAEAGNGFTTSSPAGATRRAPRTSLSIRPEPVEA